MAFSMKKRSPRSLKMIAPHTTTDGEYLTFFLMQDSSTLSSTSSDKPTYYRKVDSSENTIWKIIIKHCILTNRVNKSQSSLQNLHAIIMDKFIGFLQMCPFSVVLGVVFLFRPQIAHFEQINSLLFFGVLDCYIRWNSLQTGNFSY